MWLFLSEWLIDAPFSFTAALPRCRSKPGARTGCKVLQWERAGKNCTDLQHSSLATTRNQFQHSSTTRNSHCHMSETRRPLQELALIKKGRSAIVIMILPARDLTTPANTLFHQPWMCETWEDKWQVEKAKHYKLAHGPTVQYSTVFNKSKLQGPNQFAISTDSKSWRTHPRRSRSPVGISNCARLCSVTIDPSHIWSPRHDYI